jgi:hypothetical protein
MDLMGIIMDAKFVSGRGQSSGPTHLLQAAFCRMDVINRGFTAGHGFIEFWI